MSRFITNFSHNQTLIYIKAIKEYGDSNLYIDEPALSMSGHIVTGAFGLYYSGKRCDLSEFWRIYERLSVTK